MAYSPEQNLTMSPFHRVHSFYNLEIQQDVQKSSSCSEIAISIILTSFITGFQA
jgi:hypothetical protein